MRLSSRAVAACAAGLVVVACGDAADRHDRGSAASALVTESMILERAQEDPAVRTAAHGTGVFRFDLETGAIRGSVVTIGVRLPRAFLVRRGTRGADETVLELFPDLDLSDPAADRYMLHVLPNSYLAAAMLDDLRAGRLYVNVVSPRYANGELRGAIGRRVVKVERVKESKTSPAPDSQGALPDRQTCA